MVYVGAKYAVVGLTTALADEMARTGGRLRGHAAVHQHRPDRRHQVQRAIKPVEPEDIAAAIIKTLNKPKTHVSVPPPLRFTAQAAQMLPPKGRRWMNKKLGLDSVFLEFDAAKRKSYEDRAQSAQGVIDSGGTR